MPPPGHFQRNTISANTQYGSDLNKIKNRFLTLLLVYPKPCIFTIV